MDRLIHLVLVVGFIFVDFSFFHDLFKPGERTSFAQVLTGLLSILVFYISINYLIKNDKN